MEGMVGSRHRGRARLITWVLAVSSVVAGIGAGSADAAESARRSEGTTGIEISRAVGKAATAFWSRQDRLAATDYHSIMPRVPIGDPVAVARGAVTPQGPAEVGADTVGPVAGSPVADGARAARPRSVEPGADGAQIASATISSTSSTSSTSTSVASSSATYNSYAWNGATNAQPAIVMGRLFFQVPGEPTTYRHFCSATVVSSEGSNTLFTAGHCVYTPQGTNKGYPSAYGWHYNVSFCPGYRDGKCPYGEWFAEGLRSTNGWINSASLRYDIGVVRTAPLNGWEIKAWVGGRGITWNQAYSTATAWYAFGYPYEAWKGYGPYFPGGDNQNLWTCASYEKRYALPNTLRGAADSGPYTIGIDCNMTGGASGGGWLRGGTNGLLNGVNSYKPTTTAGLQQMFSPYFGDAAANLFNAVRSG